MSKKQVNFDSSAIAATKQPNNIKRAPTKFEKNAMNEEDYDEDFENDSPRKDQERS